VERVAVVGPVAAGKTTLASQLGKILNLPVFDLDDFYYRRDPLPTPEEWSIAHEELVGADRWIIAGDYRAVADARFLAADTVVWLDFSRSTCLYRVTRRKLSGNPSPLVDCWRWIWRYPKHGRHETEASLTNPNLTCRIYRLRSSRDISSFLSDIEI
jgi:nicotinamide riboside kinase